MTDLELAAELRRLVRRLQAELQAEETRAGRPPAPDSIKDNAIARCTERVEGIEMKLLRCEFLSRDRPGLLAAGTRRIKCDG